MIGIKQSFKGTVLVLEIETNDKAIAAGTISGSGKSKVFATTKGNATITLPNGKEISLGVNAYQKV